MGWVMFAKQCGYLARGSFRSGHFITGVLIVCVLMLTRSAPGPATYSPGLASTPHANLPNTSYQTPAVLRSFESFPGVWFSAGDRDPLPNLYEFIARVTNHERGIVRGVYVPRVFALPVVQQPKDDYSFISLARDKVTQFSSATYFGVIGLLAHNYLSGSLFHQLAIGQPVIIVMGDGSTRRYIISESVSFQRLQKSARSDKFIDLISRESYSTTQVFNRFYRGEHHLTFQTCLEKDGDLDWGVLFILALPVETVYAGHPAYAH